MHNIYASFTPEAYQPKIIRFELLLHTVQVNLPLVQACIVSVIKTFSKFEIQYVQTE